VDSYTPNRPTEGEYRYDAAYLLGSASYFMRQLAEGKANHSIARDMAAEWVAAYERFQRGERARLFYSGGA